MKNYNDIAVIMKKIMYQDGSIEYVPLQVLEGTYDAEDYAFIDLDGTPYYHIIENPGSIGFMYRENIMNYKKNFPYLTPSLIKAFMLNSVKKYTFRYCLSANENKMVPTILFNKKNGKEEVKLLLDNDIIAYYLEEFPTFVEGIFSKVVENEESPSPVSAENKELSKSLNDALDIAKIYAELTSKVIDQDEPISKILTAVWKQYNNFSDNKSRNILINGSTGVGKTETFRLLTKMLKVPYYMTATTDYTAAGYIGKSVEDMLIGLLKNANYDLEKAQRGILIIDEIDKLSETNKNHSQINQKDVQEGLLKILEDGVFTINVNNKEYEFDTKNLLVIGMGSWSRIELEEKRPVGFESKPVKKEYKDITREDIVAAGMIPELIGRFPNVVQMNELNYDSFIRILKSENNMLTVNKRFFRNRGVSLTVSDEAIDAIARKAHKQKYGARSLDEIIETALSIASFEIAKNPNVYSELIITPETIENNKKYTLVRRKEEQK